MNWGVTVKLGIAAILIAATVILAVRADQFCVTGGGGPDLVVTQGGLPGACIWPTAAPVVGGGGGGGGGGKIPVLAPYDVLVRVPDQVRPGSTVPLTIQLTNTGQTAQQDSTLSWWLTDPNGTVWDRGRQSILVARGLTTLLRHSQVPPEGPLGAWTAHARIQPPTPIGAAESTDTFQVRPLPLWVWGMILGMAAGILLVLGLRRRRRGVKEESEEEGEKEGKK